MKARLADLTLTFTGKQRLTLELEGDFREEYDQLKDALVDITVKKYRKRRSLDANSYFWVLCDRLAGVIGEPKEQIYRHCIRDIGGNCETVCVKEQAVNKLRQGWEHNGLGWVTETIPSKLEGCVNVVLYYGSSTYDTAQMTRLIDNIIQDCKEQGIETMTPAELARLEGYEAEYFTGRS